MTTLTTRRFLFRSPFIFFVTFLDHLSISIFFGTIIPLMLAKESIFTFSIDKNIAFGLFLLIYPVCQSIAAILWGYLADKIGRRPILIITVLGSIIGYFLMGLGIAHHQFSILILGRVISAITAVNTAIVQASVADMSEGKSKAKRFNGQFIAVSLGFIIGPYFIDGLSHGLFFSSVYIGVAIAYLLAFILLVTTFKETFSPAQQNGLTFRCRHIFSELKNKDLHAILFVWVVFQFGWALFFQYSGDYLYQSKHISNEMINHIFSWLSLGALIAQGIIVPFLLNRWSLLRLSIVGIFSVGLSLILLSFFNLGFFFTLFISIYCLGIALFLTGIYSYISNLVDANAQARTMTLLAAIQGIMTIVATGLGSMLMLHYLATPYVVGGGLILLAAVVLARIKPKK